MEKAKIIFGRRLRVLRKARGMTLEKLGKAASLGYKHVADIERGIKVPSFDAIDRLAEALGVEPQQFFLREENNVGELDKALEALLEEVQAQSQADVKRCVVQVLTLLARGLKTEV